MRNRFMGKKKAKRKRNEKVTMQDLGWLRYNLRRFLRFSEKAARACGVTPQQHQLMLGIAGFTDDGRATISDLAEFLQDRNNSVVGLVERAAESGLVRRRAGDTDSTAGGGHADIAGQRDFSDADGAPQRGSATGEGWFFDPAANETGARQLRDAPRSVWKGA